MPSDSLEQQAMDRVARMYSTFDRRAGGSPEKRAERSKPEPEARPEPQTPEAPAEKPKPQRGLLEYLMKDKDQSLILLLLVILMNEGADMNLLLALIYLLI